MIVCNFKNNQENHTHDRDTALQVISALAVMSWERTSSVKSSQLMEVLMRNILHGTLSLKSIFSETDPLSICSKQICKAYFPKT